VERLSIALDLLDALDDFLLKNLLSLFHLMHLAVEWLVFRGRGSAARVLGRGRLQGSSRTLKGRAAFPDRMVIGKVLMILVGRWDPLSLIVMQAVNSILRNIIVYLGLVFIALDHLLEMLFHGQLTGAARDIILLLFLPIVNLHGFGIFGRLLLLLILHLGLIESVGGVRGALSGPAECLLLVHGQVELEGFELLGRCTGLGGGGRSYACGDTCAACRAI